MTSLLAGLIACVGVPTATILTPWCLVRIMAPRAPRDVALAALGLTTFLLNLVVPCLMHLARLPIDQSHLALCHFAGLLLAAITLRLLRRDAFPSAFLPLPPYLWLIFLLLAIMIVPFTHMAGIDTYKWQDLATNMAVEQNVPWLVHPLSLAGFTPRSYPSLHPLTQGSLQILSGVGVDGAFWLTSLVIAFTGVFAANLLASTFTSLPRRQAGLAALYVLSPVFMRYVHWGTGRGVYLALLPIFVWSLLQIRRPAGIIMSVLSGGGLILAHKAGIPTFIILLPAMALGLLLPIRRSWTIPLLLAIALGVGILLAPTCGASGLPGQVIGYLVKDLRRFAWVGMATVIGVILYPRTWDHATSTRACLGGLLVTLPLAHHTEMYGAMLALPFVSIAAWRSILHFTEDRPDIRRFLYPCFATLTLTAALGIVAHRSIHATPPRVYRAAMFLEQRDPRGPFRVVASQRHGIHIQGYVSGCPRFSLHATDANAPSMAPPPLHTRGSLRARASTWISYLRGFLAPPGIAADWYGGAQTVYHVLLDDNRTPPQGSTLIYNEEGVKIFEQPTP